MKIKSKNQKKNKSLLDKLKSLKGRLVVPAPKIIGDRSKFNRKNKYKVDYIDYTENDL